MQYETNYLVVKRASPDLTLSSEQQSYFLVGKGSDFTFLSSDGDVIGQVCVREQMTTYIHSVLELLKNVGIIEPDYVDHMWFPVDSFNFTEPEEMVEVDLVYSTDTIAIFKFPIDTGTEVEPEVELDEEDEENEEDEIAELTNAALLTILKNYDMIFKLIFQEIEELKEDMNDLYEMLISEDCSDTEDDIEEIENFSECVTALIKKYSEPVQATSIEDLAKLFR